MTRGDLQQAGLGQVQLGLDAGPDIGRLGSGLGFADRPRTSIQVELVKIAEEKDESDDDHEDNRPETNGGAHCSMEGKRA